MKKYQQSTNLIVGYINNAGLNDSGVITDNNNYVMYYAPVIAGQVYTFAYTFSTPISGFDDNYVFGFFTSLPQSGSTTYNNSRTVVTYSDAPNVVTIPNGVTYIGIRATKTSLSQGMNVMFNQGNNLKPYEPYGYTWQTKSPPKYGTATETIQSGDTIYSDGTAITSYTLKGNTVQSGTPTPSNPVDVQGVGNKTANLSSDRITGAVINSSGVIQNASDYDLVIGKVEPNKTYTMQLISSTISCVIGYFTQKPVVGDTTYDGSIIVVPFNDNPTPTVTIPTGVNYIAIRVNSGKNVMVNEGSTIKPYEPYGYKIPISSGGVTTPIYSSQQLYKIGEYSDNVVSSGTATYNIKKLVLTGQESFWSDDGTVDTRSRYRILPTGADTVLRGNRDDLYCTHFKTDLQFSANSVLIYNGTTGVFIYFYVPTADYPTLADFKTYIQQQYAAGTPVTLYYILATPTTETVTAPSIPTTEGANTITVDTTVQPSEFSATWTGWHNASVKEKSENLFDKDNAERFHYGKGENNTVGYAYNAAMFCFKISHNTNYACKVYDEHNTMLRIYRSHYPLTKPESSNTIEYVELIEREASLNPEVTINSGDCDYLWIQFTGSWYDSYSGNGVMLNEGSTALPYEPYWK